ncbi:MAG: hypothetical protein ACK40H_08500, partial [Sphingomonadaceae bacterium]
MAAASPRRAASASSASVARPGSGPGRDCAVAASVPALVPSSGPAPGAAGPADERAAGGSITTRRPGSVEGGATGMPASS